HTSHAFHSRMMEPILDAFRGEVERCTLSAPAIPVVSNLTGTWLTADQATDPGYWASHLRAAVRFADGVTTLAGQTPSGGAEAERAPSWLLEVGPGQTLATLARHGFEPSRVVASSPHPRDPKPSPAVLLEALGRLWLAGVEVDWQGFWHGQRRRRVPLPAYPFQRKRYWLEARKSSARAEDGFEAGLERRDDLRRWSSVPVWRQEPPLPATAAARGRWLVFAPATEAGITVGEALARELERGLEAGGLIRVVPGESYERRGEVFTLGPEVSEHFERLFSDLAAADEVPERIVYAWTAGAAAADAGQRLDDAELEAFSVPLWIARGLEIAGRARGTRLTLLSAGVQRVTGSETLVPERALLLGPLEVLPQEYPGLEVDALDLDAAEVSAMTAGDRGLVLDLVAALVPPRPRPVRALRGGDTWERSFRELPLEALPGADLPARLREGGVYLITGGLGGLGLEIARELARRGRMRLVLLGRHAPPPAAEWRERLAAGDALAPVLARLVELEEAGAEVLAVAADVTDEAALTRAVAKAEERFGPLHGVFHCAGVAGGGIAQLKSREEARRVLAPKVRGTLALERVLGASPLDFFLLFSSVNGVLGGFGQSDYAAANAFEDAFARSRYRRRGTYWAAVAWDRWERVGMAARSTSPLSLAGSGKTASAEGDEPSHPLLGVAVLETQERVVFVQEMSPATRWELAEHRIAGHPTLPGTTYLEMARAAFERVAGSGGAVEIAGVAFLAPLVVPDGGRRQVMLALEAEETGGWSFRVASAEPGTPLPGLGETAGAWIDHAQGRVKTATTEPPVRHDLAELRRRCSSREITTEEGEARRAAADFLDTGTRWRSLTGLELGEGEGLALLDLPAEVTGDLERYVLHPALLDAAAGAVQFLGEGNFLPLAYDSLVVRSALPARGFGWLRLRSAVEPGADILSCDLSVLDEAGVERVAVKGFSMRRVGEEMTRQLRAQGEAPVATPESAVGDGILPEEGVEVLMRVLETAPGPNLVVTTRSLAALERHFDALDRDALAARLAGAGAGSGHQRPELSSEYAEPGSDLERRIAATWRRVLGLDKVGVHDNFFELGGTSLNAIQLVSELKQELGRDLPNVAVFEAPTVAALARYLAPEQQVKVTDAARDRAEKRNRALGRRPRPRTR
ncbi:MAG: SDR family NAD(P)-dependent oxidoreductase, partial [Acidobacteria bacterium]|nr:SDR family NAD(P)-dependent oxidoreductase [Acidobacteriota bacterium]